MTPDRFRRLRAVLDRRQPDLTVLMDSVHKPHNVSAILRSCDAAGLLEAHAVWLRGHYPAKKLTSGGAAKWLTVRTHADAGAAIAHLKHTGHRVLAAHPGPPGSSYLDVDFTGPTALLFGAELTGVSERALALADQRVHVPMEGHAESLNVSVAAAVMLFEARRQRAARGLYDRSRLPSEVYHRTLFEWAHPRIAAYCRRHGRAYPEIDEEGAIVGDAWRVN